MAAEEKKVIPRTEEDSLTTVRRTAATATTVRITSDPSLLEMFLGENPDDLMTSTRRLARRAPCKTLGAAVIGIATEILSIVMSLKVAPKLLPFAYIHACPAALTDYLKKSPSTCEDGDDILRAGLHGKETALNITACLFLLIAFIGSRWTRPKTSSQCYKWNSVLISALLFGWAFLFYTLPTTIETLGVDIAEADACQAVLTNSTAVACTRYTSSTFSSKSSFFAAYLLPTYLTTTAAILLIRSWCLQCSLPAVGETESLLPTHDSGSGDGAGSTGAAKPTSSSVYYGT